MWVQGFGFEALNERVSLGLEEYLNLHEKDVSICKPSRPAH